MKERTACQFHNCDEDATWGLRFYFRFVSPKVYYYCDEHALLTHSQALEAGYRLTEERL